MADDGFLQLVPQKRSLDQGKLSAYLESKAQCFSGHVKDFPCSESFFNCRFPAVQEDVSGVCESQWSSTTGIGSIAGINVAEAIGKDKPESKEQTYPKLSSPAHRLKFATAVCFR
ncbi:hypothetical protein N7523_010675 [Penicillium sp. IBT 18751x]|nr:hypothetical protein N7523_010675 [Penicillium sp. IBT 18751x]